MYHDHLDALAACYGSCSLHTLTRMDGLHAELHHNSLRWARSACNVIAMPPSVLASVPPATVTGSC